ncbi:glucose-1-phosphate thymidylyltransferase RfbA [Candidatus Woesearchaeota archaeon]|nr:glucose-1-phosphate thymidylyltransferase RfbA [Candidatus Woesearchaeota archaeon]
MKYKGIILAGGHGTRLQPMTNSVISKQLIPIYDKPMIYYPLTVLMMANIKDIQIISTPHHIPIYKEILKSGEQWGLNLQYKIQEKPEGLPQAFTLGKEFIGNDNSCLILGDNVFYGHGLPEHLKAASSRETGGTVFAYQVKNPKQYGVVTFDKDQKVTNIEEKPQDPKSNWALTGLYFFDNQVAEIASNLKKSQRGEYEITDVMKAYLKQDNLHVEKLGRGFAWLDTGTPRSLLDASLYVGIQEERTGQKISCPEEIAYRMNFITASDLEKLVSDLPKSEYSDYLKKILKD